jgi:hypothetical protein
MKTPTRGREAEVFDEDDEVEDFAETPSRRRSRD